MASAAASRLAGRLSGRLCKGRRLGEACRQGQRLAAPCLAPAEGRPAHGVRYCRYRADAAKLEAWAKGLSSPADIKPDPAGDEVQQVRGGGRPGRARWRLGGAGRGEAKRNGALRGPCPCS